MPKNHITVFEHQELKVGNKEFTQKQLNALEKFYGNGEHCTYFNLIRKGVKFKEYVGVLQVGETTIEILPKADKNNDKDTKSKWRDQLIYMLKTVGAFNIKAPTQANLNLNSNSILDLYFELFIKEAEYLFHNGLIKKYRRTEGNTTSLKGALDFGKHIQKNLVHQERFYIKHSTYDQEHLIHKIIYKTLLLLKNINNNVHLQSRIGSLLLNFPEMPPIKVIESTFNKITLNRKSSPYQSILNICKLLLLNYHPDVSKGQDNVLAIIFNMNELWEQFVYHTLRKELPNFNITNPKHNRLFWTNQITNKKSSMRPDYYYQK